MAKRYALLIGISHYGEGLLPIPSAVLDVEKMAEVLRDPELGGMDEQHLQVLKDPGRTELASAIESFYADKQTDDLLLFYFSGHGFRDEDRQLLLSSAETRKVTNDGKSRVQRATTLAADEVQGFMERSRSRRQVVILDCCFSGAFAEGLTVNKGEGPMEIKEMLGGKGRAVLTSSDAIETSKAPEAGDGLSVYTRFLVEGIQTGAADRKCRGWLDAEDLHLYAERRVHEIAPAMTPQFFPTREGHSIQVCRVRREPSVAYRQKVQELAESRGKISPAGREILADLSAELKLTAEKAGQIEAEVLQTFRDYAGKLERYRSAAKATLEAGGSQANGLSSQDCLELKELEQRLKLRAADAAAILNKLAIKEEGQAEDLRQVLSAPADASGASQDPQSAVQATNHAEYAELQHQTECVEGKNSKIFAEKRSDSSVDSRLIAEYNLYSSSGYAISVICARPATWSFSVYDGLGALSSQFYQQIDCTLLEELVSSSIGNPTFNDGLSRTLLNRFMPKELKKYFFQSNQIVLLLDDTTTYFPWELVGGSPTPFALGTLLVRLPQTSPLPKQERQATSRSAYVIGNPSSEGFFKVFAGEGPKGSTGMASLYGARTEAEKVLTLLEGTYSCQSSIDEENGVDVINKLYQQPYRVLHIAGHGVYEHPTRQGERRSGVVLSGGILITAAEIEAMEVVPDLVFLNCCHLGPVKREPVAFNRLAASVARQLIEMGVRAVVACGWAVDDQAALVFAEVFYTAMLNCMRFGEAVFLARKEAHAAVPASNTWGAYQAYGDPAYQLETSDTGPADGSGPSP